MEKEIFSRECFDMAMDELEEIVSRTEKETLKRVEEGENEKEEGKEKENGMEMEKKERVSESATTKVPAARRSMS
jgi:hypothetical protein